MSMKTLGDTRSCSLLGDLGLSSNMQCVNGNARGRMLGCCVDGKSSGVVMCRIVDRVSGAGYLLKEKRQYLSKEEMIWRLTVHDAIAPECGSVVLLHEAMVNGRPMTCRDGRLFELQTYVDGPDINVSDCWQLRLLSSALAELHLATMHYDCDEYDAKRLHKEPRARLGKAMYHRALMQNLLAEIRCERLAETLLRELTEAGERLADVPGRLQPVHGDPTPENAVLTPQGCVLVDLDDMHCAPRCEDLAWLLTWCAAVTEEKGTSFGRRWDTVAIAAVLDGYQDISKLSSSERRTLVDWCIVSIVCAVTDAFFDGMSLPSIDGGTFAAECEKAIDLIHQLKAGEPLG